MMSLLYATNPSHAPHQAVMTASAASAGAGIGVPNSTSRSRLDDEINQTSFKVRKYIENKISMLDPTTSAGAIDSSGTDTKSEFGKLILDVRKRAMYARQLQQQQQERKQNGSSGRDDNDDNDDKADADEARRFGDLVAKMRETTTAEYCALKERAAALEKQKMALDAELNLCIQSLQVVGQAGSSVIDCDEWYTSTIVPALDGTCAPVSTTSSSASSFALLQSRNDEDISGRSSFSSSLSSFAASANTLATPNYQHQYHHLTPFIDTIRRKEEDKRCAEVIASLATKKHHKQQHVEGQWTAAEDDLIIKAVSESNSKPFTSWTALSEFLPGRTGKQIRERWFNSLDPNINKSPFSPEDDDLLWESHQQYGKKWVEIAAKSFNGYRSANQVKNRWHSAKFKDVIQAKYGEGAYQRSNAVAALKAAAATESNTSSNNNEIFNSSSSSLLSASDSTLSSSSSHKRDLIDDDSTATPELKKARN